MFNSPPAASSASNLITLCINGDLHTCPRQTRLPELIKQLGLNPRLIAIEYNGEILHRQFWTETTLQTDDHLEIVTIVGGG